MIEVVVQLAVPGKWVPADADFARWVEAALIDHESDASVTIRVVDADESRAVNKQYRGKDYPTNVLSFPAELPDMIDVPDLGDLLLCAPVVASEATEQGKAAADHWAHLVVHGVLHLLGHDHEEEQQAEIMESLEITILGSLGIGNPYFS